MEIILEKAARIKLVIFDVDGVLTDRKIYLSESGSEYKAFNAHDGLGIKLLLKNGIHVGVITSRQSKLVATRMAELGVNYVYQGQHNKLAAYHELLNILAINASEVAYVGDDLPDVPLIKRVGLGIAVADASWHVRQQAIWCTQLAGGQGAAREVCELILDAKGLLDSIYEQYV